MCHDPLNIRKVICDLTKPFSDKFLNVIIIPSSRMYLFRY